MPFGNPALGGVPGVWTGGYAGYAGHETSDEDEDYEDEPTGEDPNGTTDTGIDEVPKKRKKGIDHYTEFRDKVSGIKKGRANDTVMWPEK